MEVTLSAVMAAGTVFLSGLSAYGAARFAAGKEVAEREAERKSREALEKKLNDELEVIHERISKTQREHNEIMTRHSDKLDSMLAGLSELKGTLKTFIDLQGGRK